MEKSALTAKAVFDRAHEILSPVERKAYLDEACADAPELRQEVESLLRALEEAGSFLKILTSSPPPTGPYLPSAGDHSSGVNIETVEKPPDAPLLSEGPGTRIGPYRLVKKLGQGGMGSVHLAEQLHPVRRQVALKIIRPGFDSAQVIARFEAERQALALMDHPNIAKVLDAGTVAGGTTGANAGRPYFVMELVRGQPLTRFCDNNKLTTPQRLELFVTVCQAIQHAHQKGIIHRDIKPSNVLVTIYEDKPVAKVIDFGIAKAIGQPLTDQPLYTQVGAIVGTWEYMSPEQADFSVLGVDTRSDVYSLGVLIYELRTGKTPLDVSRGANIGLSEMVRRIKEEEPLKPSTRIGRLDNLPALAGARRTEPARWPKLLRGELDLIVMKALEKDRTRRYESASALARDVQHYLADEPVEACPPSARYRLGKFARKHRALLAAAGGLVAVLLLGIVGLTVGIIVVNNERVQKEKALDLQTKAERQTGEALDLTDAAIEAMVRYRTRLGDNEKMVLRKLVKDYERLAIDAGVNKQTRATAARTQFRVANMNALIGEPAEAQTGYDRAIQLYRALAEEFPDEKEFQFVLPRTYFNQGIVLDQLNDFLGAETAYRKAIALHEKLIRDFPDQPTCRRDLADDLNNLGVFLKVHDQGAAAEEVFRQAVDLGEKVAKENPKDPGFLINLGATYANLANLVRDLGQPNASLNYYDRAKILLAPFASKDQPVGDAPLFFHNACWDRANALGQLGRHAEAIEDWRRAIELDSGSDKAKLQLFLIAAEKEVDLDTPGQKSNTAVGRFYDAAITFARAAGAAEQVNEPSLQQHYAKRTLALLKQALEAGFFRDVQHIERMTKEKAFDSLRSREDFKKFVAGLDEGKTGK